MKLQFLLKHGIQLTEKVVKKLTAVFVGVEAVVDVRL